MKFIDISNVLAIKTSISKYMNEEMKRKHDLKSISFLNILYINNRIKIKLYFKHEYMKK
jgi:hypothetical protein